MHKIHRAAAGHAIGKHRPERGGVGAGLVRRELADYRTRDRRYLRRRRCWPNPICLASWERAAA
jgi:hypothetical protein